MANRKSMASVLLFVGSTLCFFLPFVTVSCGGIKAFTLTGQQMATGTTLTQPQPFGAPRTEKVPGEPFAAVAWLCAIVGIGLSLAGQRLAAGTAASGAVGAVSLLILRSRLDEQIQKQTEGMGQVSSETGYALAVLLLIAGAGWNIYLFLQSRRLKSPEALTPGGQHGSQSSGARASSNSSPCVQCGKPVGEGVRFCESCGKPSENLR